MTSKPAFVIDIEVAPNAFGLGIKRVSDGMVRWYEYSEWEDFDRNALRAVLRKYLTVGFNSRAFDLPLIYMALDGWSNSQLMEAADTIIEKRLPYWMCEREFGVSVPKIDHIDLFDVNPSIKDSLKALAGRMHLQRLQDLPFKPGVNLSYDEWQKGKDYCLNSDLVATQALLERMEEPIRLREALAVKYETVDLRSKSDAQVGETIISTVVNNKTGGNARRISVKPGTTFRYEPPEWISFETQALRDVFDVVKNTDFVVSDGGKVSFPREFSKFNINIDGLGYTMGIGGLHSKESNRYVKSDAENVLIDVDVASQYPRIILLLGLFPKSLGKNFLNVYNQLVNDRLASKRSKDKVFDKGLKIAINGAYGKLGSSYSILHAPHLMIATTLTGQLSLLMLIERGSLMGIPAVSANTDGVVFNCPRSMFGGFGQDYRPIDSKFSDLTSGWERRTGFQLEFAEYEALYNQSVNTYFAIKPDGSYKRKGSFANHWREDLPWGGKNTDYDPLREGLKKNPSMQICSDAVLGYLLHSIPIEETIRGCQDVREFLTVVKATGGAEWNGDYLGRIVRYYWSKDGKPVYKCKAHEKTGNKPKVPNTEGCRPLMTLPEDLSIPDDLDYQRYIAEAYKILSEIGLSLSFWQQIVSRMLN